MAYYLWMSPEQQLDWLHSCEVEAIPAYIGQRIRTARLGGGESQHDFAKRAGVPLRTYKRLESNGQASLQTFVRVLRTIGRAHYLVSLFGNDAPPQRVHATRSRSPTAPEELWAG